jgi:uncharacterized membrane protein
MRPSGLVIVLALALFFMVVTGGIEKLSDAESSAFVSRVHIPLILVACFFLFAMPRHTWRALRRAYDSALPHAGRAPEEMLRQRFARGELSEDRYQESILELLKDRYVSGELPLEEYEARAGVLIDDSRARRLRGGMPERTL